MDSPVKDNITSECFLPVLLLYLVWWVFTFSWWGSAGVSASANVSVSLHAAGAAPAAPAAPAGPHAPWRAARVRARLANAAAAPLCGALPSGTSRIRTCCTPARPVRLKPSMQFVKQQNWEAHRSVWGSSLRSVQTLVPLIWCCCSSGSCCGSHCCYAPPFSSQGLSLSLESLQRRAQEHFNSNNDIFKIRTSTSKDVRTHLNGLR